ncbi:hypothetical protein PGT21_012352 [Puccinia graminis f. sp. tritici]|uniref:Uncharacterized protein n=1 Tax=Puccinia graminis f. sp. tritici TaxID=56615 RepID=A0A5B0PKY3_PUCGR|nr:hypothetical protein PGT21_012352 [Puccinia graminis f. sp. tritici]
MHKADSSQDYDQPGHYDTIQRGDASQLHYGQLAVAAARSVTQTFQVKLKPHATSAATTTQSMKRQITLHITFTTHHHQPKRKIGINDWPDLMAE